MNEQEKETSLKYFYERVLESFEYNTDEYYAITDALNEAWIKYEEEGIEIYKEGYKKGYEEGVKYTDGLISEERFPF
jgi:flagellar biosynthesis/type III secretory pathway protein FliH